MQRNRAFFQKGLLAFLLPFSCANAEIIIHGTRVIYPSDTREITLQVSNNGNKPALVQAWIDEGDAKTTPDQSKAPFMITPPIARVEGNKGQALRITALPNANELSQTQETLYWLNILDIPPRPTAKMQTDAPDNFLQLAIRSRIKFFYRPDTIKENVNVAPEKLQWRVNGSQLHVKNPTAFYITIPSIFQENAAKPIDILPEGLMLKPFSEETVSLKTAHSTKMTFITINDYGGRIERDIKLQ